MIDNVVISQVVAHDNAMVRRTVKKNKPSGCSG